MLRLNGTASIILSGMVRALRSFHSIVGPLWGPSSNHSLCGWYMIRRRITVRTDIQPVRLLTLSVLITMVTILGGILSPSAASAATYYVATTGSDANPGTLAQPFRTIAK